MRYETLDMLNVQDELFRILGDRFRVEYDSRGCSDFLMYDDDKCYEVHIAGITIPHRMETLQKVFDTLQKNGLTVEPCPTDILLYDKKGNPYSITIVEREYL